VIVNLGAAGNIVVPAYLALLAKGYVVRCERSSNDPEVSEWWVADGPLGSFRADDTITLLGVIAVAETRGEEWPASDSEIDAFFKRFGYDAGE
jgi:hypothetical protein